MPLSIDIIRAPDDKAIAQLSLTFPDIGGTIGRSPDATLFLEDYRCELSNLHAEIKQAAQGYVVIDHSTNGLFLNDATQPIGKGNQALLHDGARLRLGHYCLAVHYQPCSLPLEKEVAGIEYVVLGDAVMDDDPFCGDPVINDFEQCSVTDFCAEQIPSAVKINPEDFQSDLDAPDSSAVNPASQWLPTNPEEFEFKLPLIEQAVDMALSELLIELSPKELESIFEQCGGRGLFSRKGHYWPLYCRYYEVQMESRDWQVRFQGYFRDALGYLQTSNGERP